MLRRNASILQGLTFSTGMQPIPLSSETLIWAISQATTLPN